MHWDYMQRGGSGEETDRYYFDEFTYKSAADVVDVPANSILVWFTLKPITRTSGGDTVTNNYYFCYYAQAISVSVPGDCYYCLMGKPASSTDATVYICDEDGNVITKLHEASSVGSQNLLLALYPAALVSPTDDPYAEIV